MAHTRPRRARPAGWRRRLASLAVPGLLVGLVSAGVAVAAWPESVRVAAEPATSPWLPAAPSPQSDAVDRTSRELASDRPALRDLVRPTPTASSTASTTTPEASATTSPSRSAVTRKPEAPKSVDKSPATKEPAQPPAKKRAPVTPTSAQLRVTGHRYTRVALNVRTRPTSSAHLVTVLSPGSRLTVTSTTYRSWTLVIHRGKGRWVHTAYLSRSKPEPAAEKSGSTSSSSSSSGSSSTGLSTARCASGSGMEAGLRSNAIAVHRAVCARYPSVTSYGGRRSGGDSFHTSGRAVDIMIPNASTGRKIADWVRANRKRLGVSEVIYAQHIWTVQRSSEGWRSMSDRGNATANHYDHVHVSVY